MASIWSDAGKTYVANNGLSGKTLRAMAVTTIPSMQAANLVSDISGEAVAAGYTRQTLANVTITKDGTNHRAKLSADAVNFGSPATGETWVGVVIFVHVNNSNSAGADIPLVFVDTNDIPTNGAAMQWTPDATTGFGTLS